MTKCTLLCCAAGVTLKDFATEASMSTRNCHQQAKFSPLLSTYMCLINLSCDVEKGLILVDLSSRAKKCI